VSRGDEQLGLGRPTSHESKGFSDGRTQRSDETPLDRLVGRPPGQRASNSLFFSHKGEGPQPLSPLGCGSTPFGKGEITQPAGSAFRCKCPDFLGKVRLEGGAA
jgi:hypothetical protein